MTFGKANEQEDEMLHPAATRLLKPFVEFARIEASGGILLLISAVVAMIWANSAFAESYFSLWHYKITIGFGSLNESNPFFLSKDLGHWINDGLMVIFFFVVGLEIKREFKVGELSTIKGAAFPIAAALGGMVVPASIYYALNAGGDGAHGWGIPMATDIAFALGVMSLLGKAVPVSLKMFLAALAIADDIGAVLVIAVFYTEKLALSSLLIGGIALALLILANKLGNRNLVVYTLLGIVVWFAFLKSGVHATIAGVLVAMCIPARSKLDSSAFIEKTKSFLDSFKAASKQGLTLLSNEAQHHAVMSLEHACERAGSPLQRMEHILHPWVTFLIMPIFALANAGVALGGVGVGALSHPITLGIFLGLVVGKQIGVTLFAWLAVKLGIASLPTGVSWLKVYATSWLCGIGFTMSLFISGLAFDVPELSSFAKIGILLASLISGVVGFALLKVGVARFEKVSKV